MQVLVRVMARYPCGWGREEGDWAMEHSGGLLVVG